jgi:hypothetical protein
MVPPLDVFAAKDRELKWLGCAETLSKALELAVKNGAGSYFVFSQETGHKNFYEVSSEGTVTRIPSPSEDAASL